MLDRLKSLAVFALVLEEGSFRGAAERLGLSASTVSYHVAELEAHFGAPLLHRTTRRVTPTALGQEVGRYARVLVRASRRAVAAGAARDGAMHGVLSVTMTSALIGTGMAQRIADFARAHPRVVLRLDVSDRMEDLVARRFDLGLRAGEMPESALRSRRIGTIARRIVRAPSLPEPGEPGSAGWIRLQAMPRKRQLRSPTGAMAEVDLGNDILVGNIEAMIELCQAGMGLATPPLHRVRERLERGDLVEALPGWSIAPIDLFAVWPHGRADFRLRRVFLDEVVIGFSTD